MTISRARLEEISLYNYLKYEVLGLNFVEQIETVPLTYNNTNALYLPSYEDTDPSPVSLGRGWVPFDEVSSMVDVSSEQSNRVSVVGASIYTVNYMFGGIKNPNTVPTSVSFYWNYVSVIEGWPGGDPPPLPIVAIDSIGLQQTGFQLGSGHKKSRPVVLYIFARNKAERTDITEVLFDALYNKSIKFIDYSEGDYLKPDGTFNASFLAPSVAGTSNLQFDMVAARTMNTTNDWSDLNKYRSSISFSMISFVE